MLKQWSELRCQIWRFLLPPPRLVEIRAVTGHVRIDGEKDDRSLKPKLPFDHIWTNKSSVPQINRQAHDVGIMYCSLTFDSNPRPSRQTMAEAISNLGVEVRIPFETPALIYCDLERDVLVPRKDDLECNDMPIKPNGRGLEHAVFRAMPSNLLQKNRYLVMPCMPFQNQDYEEMQAYFKSLTGL